MNNDLNKKPFCLYPWFHALARSDGTGVPCCRWTEHDEKIIPKIPFKEFFHSEYMNEFRKKMFTNDLPHSCKSCKEFNDVGLLSDQKIAEYEATEVVKVDYQEPPRLRSQEVNFSNLCNIKCRTCHSLRSTKWIAEEIKLGLTPRKHEESNWSLSDEDVKHIKFINFLGGEPLLHQDQIIVELSKLKKINRLHEVELCITTNMTIEIKKELKKLLLQSRATRINASIDGYGKLNDYIRTDSKWEDVERNTLYLDKLAGKNPNFNYQVVTTYCILNCNKLADLYNWIKENLPNKSEHHPPIPLGRPEYLSVQNLPNNVKAKVRRILVRSKNDMPSFSKVFRSNIIHLSRPQTSPEDEILEQFRKYTGWLDKSRNQKLKDVNPEMAKWLGLK